MSRSTSPPAPFVPTSADSAPDVVERVSEMCFGLFMALSFVGAVSTSTQGSDAASTMARAALGCNLAWGLVDAVMYLVNILSGRGSRLALVLAVKSAPDAASGIRIVRNALPPMIRTVMTDANMESLRINLVNLETLPDRPRLHFIDIIWALRVFLIVVLSTFPVVVPFLLLDDVPKALLISRLLTLAMLFGGGFILGRRSGFGAWQAGFAMMVLGVCLTAMIIALGG